MLVTALLGCNSQTKLFTHLKCTIHCILVNSQSWATISTISFRTFPSPPKEAPYLSTVTPHVPSTPSTLSPVTFCIWLLSLSITFSRFTMSQHISGFHPFFLLNNIPICGETRFCLFIVIHQWMNILAIRLI